MMSAEKEFIEYPKADAHNHLNLGMRYSTYVKWAHYFIPDFPRPLRGLDEMHKIITDYTRPRCQTQEDVEKLLDMSIEDAIADSVTVLEGSVDISFAGQYGNLEKFLRMVEAKKVKFKDRIDLRPELGMGKTFDIEKIKQWAPECIKSGVFYSIDLYGPEVEEDIQNFLPLFMLAARQGLKKKAHVGEFSDSSSVRHFAEYFELDEIQHGIGAAQDEQVLRFLADKKIRLNICPASNVKLGAVSSLKQHPIRQLLDAGIPISIGTDDLLFFDRSISEQITDLVRAEVISRQEAFIILDAGLKVPAL